MKQAIPEIYVQHCSEALGFYQTLFGGEIKNLQMSDELALFRDMPGKVVHAELHVNPRCVFYFVDVMDEARAKTGNITMVLHLDDKGQTEQVYHELSKKGAVLMPLQKTFWGAWHAIVTDRYGAPWALSCTE